MKVHFFYLGLIATSALNSLSVMIACQHGAMMFGDKIIDAARQTVFMRQCHSVWHVRNNCSSRFCRINILMGIHFSLRLILNEECWVHGFAHIMEKSAYSRQQRVG